MTMVHRVLERNDHPYVPDGEEVPDDWPLEPLNRPPGAAAPRRQAAGADPDTCLQPLISEEDWRAQLRTDTWGR